MFTEKLLRAYAQNKLTLDQYRVLLGLYNHGDEAGAEKGFCKIMRRARSNG